MSQHDQNVATVGQFPSAELRAMEKSIRRILRASDLQSRALIKAYGLTTPQLVILKAVAALGEVSTTVLSAQADLSPATVITILDKLEERQLIQRYRSPQDRRIVHTRLTQEGAALVSSAPEPLGESFAKRFSRLDFDQQRTIMKTLEQVASMLEGNPRHLSIKPDSGF